MNPAIAKVAALGLLGLSLLSAEVEVARTVSSRVLAWTSSSQIAAMQHAAGILASTVADEAHGLARDAAYDVALSAVRGASAVYASTLGGLQSEDRVVRVQKIHRMHECGGGLAKPCSIERIKVRVRSVETG